ncbi:MAG: hypothetical protein R2724_23395 [Bryobacterales bacterium]
MVKCLAPLTTSELQLREGLRILAECVNAALDGAEEPELAGVNQ